MQSLKATWNFARTQPARGPREPVGLDALHALQCWRVGHPGRAFRVVRASPFLWTDQLQARLIHGQQDQRADTDLCLWCQQHRLVPSALEA